MAKKGSMLFAGIIGGPKVQGVTQWMLKARTNKDRRIIARRKLAVAASAIN